MLFCAQHAGIQLKEDICVLQVKVFKRSNISQYQSNVDCVQNVDNEYNFDTVTETFDRQTGQISQTMERVCRNYI